MVSRATILTTLTTPLPVRPHLKFQLPWMNFRLPSPPLPPMVHHCSNNNHSSSSSSSSNSSRSSLPHPTHMEPLNNSSLHRWTVMARQYNNSNNSLHHWTVMERLYSNSHSSLHHWTVMERLSNQYNNSNHRHLPSSSLKSKRL